MDKIAIGVLGGQAGLVPDNRYAEVARWLCQHAQQRIYASVFIVDVSSSGHQASARAVLDLLQDMRDAVRRGVDVRLAVGGSRNNPDIADSAEGGVVHARRLGIPSKMLSLYSDQSSHKKLLVVDDRVLIGSHNWSEGAFSDQTQDSVLVENAALASWLADELAAEWRAAESRDPHAAV
jgi:phosphatidylserine/phosphatidylglycerophosphate/cardiolipin synthase-like enzyme